ncbi:unnamed protein product [Discosporangium mesarthrocarpum]
MTESLVRARNKGGKGNKGMRRGLSSSSRKHRQQEHVESIISGEVKVLEGGKGQGLGKKRKVSSSRGDEKIIESFSCALYSGGLPLHGRLSVTSRHVYFAGWRNSKVVLALSELEGVEKASTLFIVPNALTLVKRDGERITLGSFLYRDDCHALLVKLMQISRKLNELTSSGDGVRDNDTLSALNGLTPRNIIPIVGGTGAHSEVQSFEGEIDAWDTLEACPEPLENQPDVGIEKPLPPDGLLTAGGFELMVDETFSCSVAQAFEWFWGPHTDFWANFLRDHGESELDATPWQPLPDSGEFGRLFPQECFDYGRELTFVHPRTGFAVVGPKRVFTRQRQVYRVERREGNGKQQGGAPTAAPMDRAVLCQTTQMEKAPLGDHFTILGRLVLSRLPALVDGDSLPIPQCQVMIGLDVVFHKSTFLRGAIRSGAVEESATTWKAWLQATRATIAYQHLRLGLRAVSDGRGVRPPPAIFQLGNDPEQRDIVAGTADGGGVVADPNLNSRGNVAGPQSMSATFSLEGGSKVSLATGGNEGWTRLVGAGAVLVSAMWDCLMILFKSPNSVLWVGLGLLVGVLGLQQRQIQRLEGRVDSLLEALEGFNHQLVEK